MPELSTGKVFKKGVEVLSKRAFSEKHASGVTISALDYAIEKGHIDWIQIGREKLIVLTKHTLGYSPNAHPIRN